MVSPTVSHNVFFILVRPEFLGNIGSCARVLKNFGFQHMRLIEPPRNYKDAEARRMAVGAFDILKQAQLFPSLDEALTDVSLAIGTTSGQQRDVVPQPFFDVSTAALATACADNKIAIVFGGEVNGLARQELQRCHKIVTIPTDPLFPALNMAQAVAICAYELTRSQEIAKDEADTRTTGAIDDNFFSQVEVLLDRVKFSRTFNRRNVLTELRQLYQRAHPTTREHDLLQGILHRIKHELPEE